MSKPRTSCAQIDFHEGIPLSGDNFNSIHLGLSAASTLAAGAGVLMIAPVHDKQRHFSAGFVAGAAVAGGMRLLLKKDAKFRLLKSSLMGVGASVIVGVGKELYDSTGRGTPSVMDAAATALGGIAGSVIVTLPIPARKPRHTEVH